MKKVILAGLIIALLVGQVSIVLAKPVEIDSKVLIVEEEQLINLAAGEKFSDLTTILKKLVQQNLSSPEEKLKMTEINITDFNYGKEGRLKIYYRLN